MQVLFDVGQAGLDGGGVELRRRLVLEAEQLGPAGERHGAAGGDHCFGGNAVPQVGGTADDVALDESDFGSEAGGVGGGRVACRSPADDDEAHGHVRSRLPSGLRLFFCRR